MDIYGIKIPTELTSNTIKATRWLDIEPLTNKKDLNSKWIGGRASQVHPHLITSFWNEDENELTNRLAYFKRQLKDDIKDFKSHIRPQKKTIRVYQNEVLSSLRAMYILQSLLTSDDYERTNHFYNRQTVL